MTITELMVAGSLMLMVMGAMLTLFSGVQRTSVRESARSQAGDAVRISMERITRDVRQSTRICPTSDGSRLDFDTYVNGVPRRVVYAVAGDSLTRQTGTGAFASCGTLTASNSSSRVFAERLVSTTVFTYDPDVESATAVAITLRVRPENYRNDNVTIELTSEAQLRNGG
ncbi:MAG TPA: hypothetical protein VM600_01190 [Actinomycetota bacterium]|nr:hypothetical protein [Actinomycetota bacterium]